MKSRPVLPLIPLLAALLAPSPPSSALSAPGRPLTAGERGILAPLFRDAVDYGAIRIVHGRAMPLQGDHTYMTIGDVVYAPGRLYRADYSRGGAAGQAALVHEVAHVWQRACGINVVAEAARTFLATRGRYRRAYRYRLAPERDLLDYSIEQQASIIEDYYGTLLSYGEAPPELRAVLRRFLADPTYARRRPHGQDRQRRASRPE